MGFEIASANPHLVWYPIDTADTATETLYVGQIVKAGSDGVLNLGSASGAADATGKAVPWGIVVSTNNKVQTYNTTYKTEYITSAATQAAQLARSYQGVEGKWSKNDPQAMVQVALIDPSTVIKGRIFNGAVGTAPTLLTVSSTTDSDGLVTGNTTTNATSFTPVQDLGTIYCRSGLNAGLYRITQDTSTTVPTVDTAYPYDVAVGDTFVRVPLRPVGQSYGQFDSEALYINAGASPATDYFILDVIVLDLATAGNEYCLFRFNSIHFDPITLRSAQ